MSKHQVDEITDLAGTGAPSFPNGISGKSDGSAIPSGAVGEYISAQSTSATVTTTADVYVDVNGMSITLTPGVWMLGYCVDLEQHRKTTGVGNSIAGLVITDSSNVQVPLTGSWSIKKHDGDGFEQTSTHTSKQTVVNISSTTTYKVRLICQNNAAIETAQVRQSGGLQDGIPLDNHMYGIRIA